MKTENIILMKQARESLKGKWSIAVGVLAVYVLISIIIGSFHRTGSIISLIISGPLELGLSIFLLSLSRGGDAKLSELFDGLKRFVVALKAYLLMMLFILLWALLLIVPGIIAYLSYSQLFFILAEDQTIGAMDALKKSKKMMDGYKWKLFCLIFRFFWWSILSILTFGIGFLWLVPYIKVTMAKFYDDLLGKTAVMQNEIISK